MGGNSWKADYVGLSAAHLQRRKKSWPVLMGVTSGIKAINNVRRDLEGKGGSYRGNFRGMEHRGRHYVRVG